MSREGITRIVFVFRDIVIKVPNFTYSWRHFLTGMIANITEKETWNFSLLGVPEYVSSDLLAPVLWASWGGWVLVMKRVQQFDENDKELIDLSEHIRCIPGDDKITNYGMLDGRVVKFDYGS